MGALGHAVYFGAGPGGRLRSSSSRGSAAGPTATRRCSQGSCQSQAQSFTQKTSQAPGSPSDRPNCSGQHGSKAPGSPSLSDRSRRFLSLTSQAQSKNPRLPSRPHGFSLTAVPSASSSLVIPAPSYSEGGFSPCSSGNWSLHSPGFPSKLKQKGTPRKLTHWDLHPRDRFLKFTILN